jgi:hypothetical protein
MDEITLASVGLQEPKDLQEWITKHPDLIAPDLLVITTEFDRWEVRDQKVADRLDALDRGRAASRRAVLPWGCMLRRQPL